MNGNAIKKKNSPRNNLCPSGHGYFCFCKEDNISHGQNDFIGDWKQYLCDSNAHLPLCHQTRKQHKQAFFSFCLSNLDPGLW